MNWFLPGFVPSFCYLKNTVCCAFNSIPFIALSRETHALLQNLFLTVILRYSQTAILEGTECSKRNENTRMISVEERWGIGRSDKSVKSQCPTWKLVVHARLCQMYFLLHKNGFFSVEGSLAWRIEAGIFAFALCHFWNIFLNNRY